MVRLLRGACVPLAAAMLPLLLAACGSGTPVELLGSWSHPDTGVRLYWYAADPDLDEEGLKQEAMLQLHALPDSTSPAELYFFYDRLLATEWASAQSRDQVLEGGLFEPATAMTVKGGGVLRRDGTGTPSWQYFPPAAVRRPA